MANAKRDSELPEVVMAGPFGGIQSELPLEKIESLGFASAENMMFRKGRVQVRPTFHNDTLGAIPNFVRIMDLVGTIAEQNWTFDQLITVVPGVQEAVMGFADFFTANGNRVQTIFTENRIFAYDGSTTFTLPWNYINKPGSQYDRFRFAVVGEKLCFSQGVQSVSYWDGISKNVVTPYAGVPAKYLCEVANHLVLANTLEGGSRAYQRVRWSGAGDPSDFISLNAGQVDMFNDLGPVNGALKLFQSGYVFQQLGITQMIPTGIGTAPFSFVPLSAHSKGLTCPDSLVAFGETSCYYVGKDNAYTFDGTSSTPIGDAPIDGRRRVGARSAILGDIMQTDPNNILGLYTSSVNGNPFSAYWIVIPGIAIWVYNVDEANWTRWTLDGTITSVGEFSLQAPVRIMDLIGNIAAQMWTPESLTNNNPFNSVALGMSDGSIRIFDFNGLSDKDAFLQTGQMMFGDTRHEKTIINLRVISQDDGPTTHDYHIWNQDNQSWDRRITMGSGTGKSRVDILQPNLTGKMLTLRVDVPAYTRWSCSELGFIYSTGGEIRPDTKTPDTDAGQSSWM
jgi:hypothetical protein